MLFLFPVRDCGNGPIFLVYATQVLSFLRTEHLHSVFNKMLIENKLVFLTPIPPHATPSQVGICSVKKYARVQALAIIRIGHIRFGRCCCELAAAKLTPRVARQGKNY
jgi:hypothetical protein